MARSADEKGDWEKQAMESFGQYGSLFFSRKSFKSSWSPFFGYFVRNRLFCMESYLAQNAKKKIPESRLQVSQPVALAAVLSSQRIQKIQPSKSFRFIVCYFSPVEVVEVALLFAR